MKTIPPAGKPETKPYSIYDVSASVKTWGRRGIVWGGIAGFALGVAFVAIPFSSQVLSFGILGTLMIATIEGAFVAGAISAFAALFYGKGVLQCEDAGFEQTRASGRRTANVGDPTALMPIADWPTRRQNPGLVATQFQSEMAPPEQATRQTVEDVRRSLNTIDAWENGSTGP